MKSPLLNRWPYSGNRMRGSDQKKSSYPDLFEQKRKVSDVPRFLMMLEPTIVFCLMQSIFPLHSGSFPSSASLVGRPQNQYLNKFIRLKRLPRLRRIGLVRLRPIRPDLCPMLIIRSPFNSFMHFQPGSYLRRRKSLRVVDQTNEDATAFL